MHMICYLSKWIAFFENGTKLDRLYHLYIPQGFVNMSLITIWTFLVISFGHLSGMQTMVNDVAYDNIFQSVTLVRGDQCNDSFLLLGE